MNNPEREYEVITLFETDSEDETENAQVLCKIESVQPVAPTRTTEIMKPRAEATYSTDTSSSVIQGLGGFINDFRILTWEIERLKASEKALKDKLKSQQFELNKASEEWCTSQAQLAKNEMLIEAQTVQMSSLKQQVQSFQIRNNTWDAKINLVSNSLEAMSQNATKLTNQDDNVLENGTMEQGNPTMANDLNLQLQPYIHNPTKSVMMNFNGRKTPFGQGASTNKLFGSSKLEQSCVQRNSNTNVVNKKLNLLRDKISKRMTQKEHSQHEIKDELAKKNRLLQNLAQLVHKKSLLSRSNFRKDTLEERPLEVIGTRSVTPELMNDHSNNNTPSTTGIKPLTPVTSMNHARDPSVSIQNGYACTCGERFKFISSLHRHLGEGDKKFVCEICNMSFLYFSTLSRHLRDNHKQFFPPNTHGCRTCGAVFPNKTALMQGWKHRNGRCIKRTKRNPRTAKNPN